MFEVTGTTWPEQEIIEAWMSKYKVWLWPEARLELMQDFTEMRINFEEEISEYATREHDLKNTIDELEDREISLKDDISRLFHAAILGMTIVDGHGAAIDPNEAWRALPEHLCAAIDKRTEELEAEHSEND